MKVQNSDGELVLKLMDNQAPPKTFFNVGVGHDEEDMNEASFFKSKWPDLKVYGVEANPDTIKIRKKDYPGELFEFGIWGQKCKKTLSVPTVGIGRSSLLQAREEWSQNRNFQTKHTFDIDCITLDDFDALVNHPENIFLWMDIEGAEFQALKGAKKLLDSGRLDYISLEVSSVGLPGEQLARRHGEPTIFQIDSYLQNFGYVRKTIYSRASIFVNAFYVAKGLL